MATERDRRNSGSKLETSRSRAHVQGGEEVDFPRGGASALSPLEVRKIRDEAEKDVLFGNSSGDLDSNFNSLKKKKKPKTPSSKETGNSNSNSVPVFEGKSKLKRVEYLTFKKLYVGMKVLGAIREVNEFDMVISLPNGLSGFVHITHINDKITECLKEELDAEDNDTMETSFPELRKFFTIGSLVQCSILELETSKPGQKKVKLSLDPKDVNSGLTKSSLMQGMVLSGYVSSVEDHGYLISFGTEDTRAFLSKNDVSQGEYQEGQPLSLLIKSVADDRRIITVSVDKDGIRDALMKEDMKLKFSTLLPGMLVKASVNEATESGLTVSFLGGFEGSVDILHLPNCGGSGENLAKMYPKKTKVQCRLLYVNTNTKTAGLSLQENIVLNTATDFGSWSVGDVIKDVTVTRVDQGLGLLMALSDGIPGFTHISRVSDEHVDKLDKKHKVGSTHRCRILGFNSLDGLVTLTMEKSVIEQPFLSYRDITPGSVVKGKIITLEKFGMLVAVSEHIRGLCTTLHLADINLKHPEKKLKEGKVVKCRVLSVEPERRRLLLTHKKTMVESAQPLICDYSDASPGVSCHGFITAVKDFGCLVTFYNNVRGLVPRVELGIPGDTDPRSVFYVGQVMVCHVLSCRPDQAKLRLTFKSSSRPGPALQEGMKPGTLVEADVVNSTAEGLDILIDPGGAPAFIRASHLTDHPSHCKTLLSVYAPPKRLTNVVYYGRSKEKSIMVSLKPSLIEAAAGGCLLTSFADLKVGMILPGSIKQVMSYGVFIEFSCGIFGLAPNSFLADQFVSEASSHFQIGQTVMAKVTEIDIERQRFLVSLKLSDCCPEEGMEGSAASAVKLLESYFVERQKIIDHMSANTEAIRMMTSLIPGSRVEAKVLVVRHEGITLQLAEGVRGLTTHHLAKGVSCEPGQVVFGCVLDWDLDKKLVIVSLNPNMVAEKKSIESHKGKLKKLKSGRMIDACVQLITSNYMVAVLPQHNYRLVYAPTKLHLNDIRDASKRFAVGQQYSAIVQSKSTESFPPLVTLQEKHLEKENIAPGIITTAQVKSVKELQMNVKLCGGRFHGRVHVTHICDDVTEGESPLKAFHNGDKVQVKVLGFRDTKTHKFLPITHRNFTNAVAELTMKPSELSADGLKRESTSEDDTTPTDNNEECGIDKKLEQYKAGDEVNCFVKSAMDHCVWMMASPSVNGRIALLHASSDLEVLKCLKTHFKPGDAYKCVVLSVDKSRQSLDLSLTVKVDSTIEAEQIYVGQVTKVLPNQGLLVQLPMHKCGLVTLTDIRDSYVDNPLEGFEVRQLVRCYVLSTKGQDRFDLSLRPSRTEANPTSNEQVVDEKKKDPEIKDLSDLKKGLIVRGYVKSCSNVGVFVSLAHHVVARVQITNLSQYFVKNWKPLFPQGKLVTAKVLSVTPANGHVELSLKGKDVGGTDPAPKPKRIEEKERKEKEKKEKKRKRQKEKVSKSKGDSDDEEDEAFKKLKMDSDDEAEQSESEQEEDKQSDASSDEEGHDVNGIKSNGLARLQLSSGFDWSEGDNGREEALDKKREHESDGESSESETEASSQVTRKKSKRQKRAAKKAEEDFLYKTEQSLLDQDRVPETAEDFDRLVLSSPNNSVVWLQYMAYHLHTTEIDKARAVAERALQTISFREEQEKLNVWVALMNLENLYGTQESLVKVFERALQQNEPKKVFFQLIGIYTRTDKLELAEQLYQTMSKRFSQSKKMWAGFGAFYMKQRKLEVARKLLQRSLKSLPKRKHIETIVKFALLEFKYGEPQRGQTMFESILNNYPKRSDLWSVYLDMMIKQGDVEPVRQVFERVIHIDFSSKKMKLFFKRYLDFERKCGDAFSVEKVKTKAMEYVESKAALS